MSQLKSKLQKSGVTVAAMRRLGKRGRTRPLSRNAIFRLSTIAVDNPVHTL